MKFKKIFGLMLIILVLPMLAMAGMNDRFSDIDLTEDDAIDLPEVTAPSGNPTANRGWIYVKDSGGTSNLYFEADDGTVTNLLAAGSTNWSDIGDPTADTTITFADNEITVFSLADTNEDMFTVSGIGAFGDVSVMLVQQITGNATDGTVLEVVAADANVDPLVVSASGKANALVVGQNTGVVTIAGVAEGTDTLVLTAGDITLTDGDLNVPGGDVTLGEDLTVTGTASIGTILMDAVTAATSTQTLALNGDTTGGVNIGSVSTGDITLGDTVVVSDTFDMTIGEGSLTIDNDQSSEVALTITSDATTSGGAIAITSAATTTNGKVISVTADDITTGDLLYLDTTASGMTSGNYINCFDGAATDFEVGLYGATTIAGNASTDVLIVTAGDIQITSGDIDLDSGFIAVDTAADQSNNITRNYNGAGTGAVLVVSDDHTASTNAALSINQDGTGASEGILITHDGDGAAIEITAGTARTGIVIDVAMANQEAEIGLLVDGAWTGASDEGMVTLNPTGSIASGAAAMFINTDTGTPGGDGFAFQIDDDSVDGGTLYSMLINSANNEGLHVEAGLSLFAELTTFTAGLDVDGDIDVDFSANTEDMTIDLAHNDEPAGAGVVTVYDDSTGQTNASYLLRLAREADADAQDHFILCEDNSTGADGNGDDMFAVDSGGAVTAAGTVTVNGANLAGDGSTILTGVLRDAEVVTATNVIANTECGKTFYLNSATEFASTLPTAATVELGCIFDFYVKGAPSGASYTIITGASLENILYGGFVEREVDTGDDGPYQAAGDTITIVDGVSVQGDHIHIESDGDVYYVTGVANADGGLTITQAD